MVHRLTVSVPTLQSVTEMSAAWNKMVLGQDFQLHTSKHKVISVPDMPSTNLLQHMPGAVAFIEQAISTGGSILVHCMAGVSRSATVRICEEVTPPVASHHFLLIKTEQALHPQKGWQYFTCITRQHDQATWQHRLNMAMLSCRLWRHTS